MAWLGPTDLWLLHAPDPRTPWRTSVRALARLVELAPCAAAWWRAATSSGSR